MSCNFFTLKMCWLKPVCEGNSRKIRGLTHHKIFILWIDLLCSKLSRNVKLHLFIATRKKSVRTDLQQSLSLVICSTFELLHCWILQKLSSNGFFVTLQKFYHILATIQFYIQTIILVHLKGWDSFCCILTSRLKFKSFAIGKCVKVITTLSVWIIFFSEAWLRSRNLKITTNPIFEDAIPVKILKMC